MEPKHGSTPGFRENVTSRIQGNSDWPSLKGGNPQPVLVHHSRAKQCASPFPIQNLPHSEHIFDSRLASLSHSYETVAVNPASINPPVHTLSNLPIFVRYTSLERKLEKMLCEYGWRSPTIFAGRIHTTPPTIQPESYSGPPNPSIPSVHHCADTESWICSFDTR